MKKIGMIGGMSWMSTLKYYELINESVENALGNHISPEIILHSLNFQEIDRAMHRGDWSRVSAVLTKAAVLLKRGGADFFILCCNSVHKVFFEVQKNAGIQGLHILHAVEKEMRKNRLFRVGLIGTEFTMSQDFHRDYLESRINDAEIIVPFECERKLIHNVIFSNLCEKSA